MLDASIVIHVAYNTTRDVRHDWHLLRHLASYPIALTPPPGYIPKRTVDSYYTYCSPSFVLFYDSIVWIRWFRSRNILVEIIYFCEIIEISKKFKQMNISNPQNYYFLINYFLILNYNEDI